MIAERKLKCQRFPFKHSFPDVLLLTFTTSVLEKVCFILTFVMGRLHFLFLDANSVSNEVEVVIKQ